MQLVLGPAAIRFTGRAEGDFSVDAAEADPQAVADRMRAVAGRMWRTAKQVHGSRVVVVGPSTADDGIGEADALLTTHPGVAVGVRTADCAPIVLAADGATPVVGVVHAGWRGLVDGVIEAAVEQVRRLGGGGAGASPVEAALGPCIGPECYEFGLDELDVVAKRYGDAVRGVTRDGKSALDLAAGVRAALAGVDVDLRIDVQRCTACDADAWFSHRARGEHQRQATVAWLAGTAS